MFICTEKIYCCQLLIIWPWKIGLEWLISKGYLRPLGAVFFQRVLNSSRILMHKILPLVYINGWYYVVAHSICLRLWLRWFTHKFISEVWVREHIFIQIFIFLLYFYLHMCVQYCLQSHTSCFLNWIALRLTLMNSYFSFPLFYPQHLETGPRARNVSNVTGSNFITIMLFCAALTWMKCSFLIKSAFVFIAWSHTHENILKYWIK